MADMIVNLLSNPTTVGVVFWSLAALEVGWTVLAVRAGPTKRDAVQRSINGLTSPVGEPWLDRWAQKTADGAPLVEGGRLALSGSPPELRGAVARTPMSVAPGLLTALGVLGTFLGIHAGLGAIDFGALSSTDSLLGAARGLLAGMKTAFATSVAGLTYAAVFMLILAISDQVRKIFAARDRAAWQQMTRPPGQGGLDAAAGQMAAAVTAMNHNLTGLFSRMEKQLEEMAALRQEQGDSLIREVVREFREEALEPLARRLDQSAEVSARAATAVENLEGSLGAISTRLAGSVEMLERFQRETHQQLQEFSTELAGTLEQTGAVIREAVDESISGMARQREAFEESADRAAQTFRGIRTDLEAALETQAAEQRASLETLRDANLAVIDRAEETYQKQAEAIGTIGEQAANTMRIAREELQAGLMEVRVGLKETSDTVKTELERFREAYQQQLSEYLKRQADALDEVLERQRKGLQQVVERLESSFEDEYARRKELSEEVAETIQQLKDGVEVLEQLAETLGLHGEARLAQLVELSREMTGQTTALEAAYRDLAAQHEKSVEASVTQLSGYLRDFNGQQQQALTRMDDAAARLVEGLYQAADILVTATTARRTA
ncbi:MAG: hypothetical protein AAFV53_30095 [Myxococcota bacterium]